MMSLEDPYSIFKSAFEVQRSELQRLYNRVSELEKVNTEVLSYVRQKGSLPVLNYHGTNTEGNDGCSVTNDSEFKYEVAFSFSSPENISKLLTVSENSGDLGITGDNLGGSSTILSDLVAQHSRELDKALETLGLEPSKRNQLLGQVRMNVNTILHSQLSRNFGSNVQLNGTEQPSFSLSLKGEKIMEKNMSRASSGGDCSVPVVWPISSLDALAFDKSVELSTQSPNHPIHGLQIPHCSVSPMEVHEKRRLELMRINHRMQNSETDALPYGAMSHRIPSTLHSNPATNHTLSPSARNSSMLGLSQSNNDLEPCSLAGTPINGISAPVIDSAKMSMHVTPSQRRSPIPQLRSCPCGNRQNCPLSAVKQRKLGNDPRVARGFTVLAAVFRGRLVRQLLATHKVYDLIRTVKDTAKLALSIHVERQNSFHQSMTSSVSSGHSSNSPGHKSDGLSPEELVLESRLMAQLRGALSQLHEIFFSWPLSNKLELLAISRSLPQRSKRLAHRTSHTREDSQATESVIDTWSQRDSIDARRRWNSGASHCGSRSPISGETRVLRQLQPHQVDRCSPSVMATEPASGETKKHTIPYFGINRISVRQCGTANTIPRPMRINRISRPQSTQYTRVSERQFNRQITKPDTTSCLQSKTTAVQKPNERQAFIGTHDITRHSARLYPGSITYSPYTEHPGGDEQRKKSDQQADSTSFNHHAATSGRSSQLFQPTSNVSSRASRTSAQPSDFSRITDRSACQSHSTPSDPAASSRCTSGSSNGQQHTVISSFHSDRSSPDADVENRGGCNFACCTRPCDHEEPDKSKPNLQLSGKETFSVIADTEQLSNERITVADAQANFCTSRIPSTRAILERSALAMAASTTRTGKNFRRSIRADPSQHSYPKRSHREALVGQRVALYSRSPVTPRENLTEGCRYPIRRRIVSSKPYQCVTSTGACHSYCISPVCTKPRGAESTLDQFEDYISGEYRSPTFLNHTEPPTEMSHASCRPPVRRWCDDDKYAVCQPQSTHSPTRLPPEPDCFGTLRATWSLDSVNPQAH